MDGYGKPGYQPLQNQQAPPGYGGVPQAPYQQGVAAPPPYPQHQAHNVVVVQQQPPVGVVHTTYSGDNYLTLSIVMSIMCFVFGCWPALLCTIPAIFLSNAARDAQVRGDMEDARRKRNISLFLNIFGATFWVVIYVVVIIAVTVSVTTGSSCYSVYYYYSYYYYC